MYTIKEYSIKLTTDPIIAIIQVKILEQEKILINNITIENSKFYGTHSANMFPVSGVLPKDE